MAYFDTSTTLAQTGTDAYADLATAKVTGNTKFSAICTAATFGGTFKVTVSNDGVTYIDHPTAGLVDVAVVVGTPKSLVDADACFAFYKVRVKNTTGGSNTVASVVAVTK